MAGGTNTGIYGGLMWFNGGLMWFYGGLMGFSWILMDVSGYINLITTSTNDLTIDDGFYREIIPFYGRTIQVSESL